MHDLVVRNGTVVDGTGAPRRQVDVAIDEGLIMALEPKAGRARREVNAEGMLVTPGWVDIHTHYDGQRRYRELPRDVQPLCARATPGCGRGVMSNGGVLVRWNFCVIGAGKVL